MGRLKHCLPSSNEFAVKYKKLEDYSDIYVPDWREFLAFSCSHCGQVQKIQAEELNEIIGNAFRLAYAAQLQKTTPSFHDVIADQLESPSLTSLDGGNRTDEIKSATKVWAKQAVELGRLNHREPVLEKMRVKSGEGEGESSEEARSEVKRGQVEEDDLSCPPSTGTLGGYANGNFFPITSSSDHIRWREENEEVEREKKEEEGRKLPIPPLPERRDSLSSNGGDEEKEDDEELRTAPWFQAGIPREIALEVLMGEGEGSFLVRKSVTKPGCFALSLRVPAESQPSGISHYLIIRTNRGYKIKGMTKEFPSLNSLITHHSVMPELLPCPLSLQRHNPNPGFDSSSEYHTLSDCRLYLTDCDP
ncbi:unnamed protein product [Darwinula stevensoni]|uniref:SH2 domain-containing protein n=1 Tax=Darwinula stevensoni TaxID=69355 RepID=A0A7R9A952_9CRUS|nr:unnamed protein product [Darwinula stevensoni]CAG0896886.1 unnamed protein product [Darwinula stevensoni]